MSIVILFGLLYMWRNQVFGLIQVLLLVLVLGQIMPFKIGDESKVAFAFPSIKNKPKKRQTSISSCSNISHVVLGFWIITHKHRLNTCTSAVVRYIAEVFWWILSLDWLKKLQLVKKQKSCVCVCVSLSLYIYFF